MLVLLNHNALRLAVTTALALFPTWQLQFLSPNLFFIFGKVVRINTPCQSGQTDQNDKKYSLELNHFVFRMHTLESSRGKISTEPHQVTNNMYNTRIYHYLQEQLRKSSAILTLKINIKMPPHIKI